MIPDGEDASFTDPDIEATRSKMDILRQDVKEKFGTQETQVPLEAGLAAVAPLDVPRVAVTVFAPNADEAVERLRTIPQNVPERLSRHPVQVELRLDILETDNDRAQLIFLVARLGVPVILTYRSPREGGENHKSDEERRALLTGIFKSLSEGFPPGSLIDVEASSLANGDGWSEVVQQARSKNLQLMVSHHDLHATPTDPARLLPGEAFLQDAPGGPALIYKSATRTRDWDEELSVLAALRQGNRKHRRYAIMGIGRPGTRLLALFYGSPLVYASIPGTPPAANGQIPFDDLLNTWSRWGVTYEDRGLLGGDVENPPRWALIGIPAVHSLSPAMHNQAAREHDLPHRYLPLQPPAPIDDPQAVLQKTLGWLPALGVVGGNITAPFKQALAQIAHRLEGPSRALGSANTFRLEDETLVATTTDVEGILDPLKEHGIVIDNQDVLILGAGGAAAAAAYAMQDASHVRVTNRTREKADALAQRLRDHVDVRVADWDDRLQAAGDASLILQATSAGMAGTPQAGIDPLEGHPFREDQVLYELIYEPRITPVLAKAREAGARTLDGLEMLLAQGARAFQFWTGKEPPLDAMKNAVAEADRIPLPESVQQAMQQTIKDETADEGKDKDEKTTDGGENVDR